MAVERRGEAPVCVIEQPAAPPWKTAPQLVVHRAGVRRRSRVYAAQARTCRDQDRAKAYGV